MKVEKYDNRHWAVREDDDTLVCVTVYKKGAEEVARRVLRLENVILTVENYLLQEAEGCFEGEKTCIERINAMLTDSKPI